MAIRITISGEAYLAIASVAPEGTLAEPKMTQDRKYRVSLPRDVVNRLRAPREPPESISDAILPSPVSQWGGTSKALRTVARLRWKAALEEARRLGQSVSALVCDIDRFRGLNDRYGHKAGDRALRNLAKVLEESIGHRSTILGRQGGDEFVILLPGIDLKAAAAIAESLCEACEARALVQEDLAAKFTISVGAGTGASGASELGEILRQADAALYRARRAGGNQVTSGAGAVSELFSAEHRTVPDGTTSTQRLSLSLHSNLQSAPRLFRR